MRIMIVKKFQNILVFRHGLILVLRIHLVSSLSANDKSTKENLTNRIGLNFQHASAYGGNGGDLSYSSMESYANHVGIKNSDGSYRPLLNDANSQGMSWVKGSNSNSKQPYTWADTNSIAGPGFATGNGQAGIVGGGNAMTSSFSTNAEIPLNDGSILYNNFKISKGNDDIKSERDYISENNQDKDKDGKDLKSELEIDKIRSNMRKMEAISFPND